MRKRPCLLLACVAVIGVLMGDKHCLWPIFLFFGIQGYAISRWIIKRRWLYAVETAMLLLVVFTGFYFQTSSRVAFRERELSQLSEGDNIKLCGEIYKKEWKNNQLTVYLKHCKAQTTEVIACNRVIVYLDADTYSIGDILLLTGQVHYFKTATNSGEFDLRAYYETLRIDFYLDEACVEKREKCRLPIAELLYDFRMRIAKVYEAALSEQKAGVLSSVLLGEKGLLTTEIKQLYQEAGISHVLAISGLHVSLIGMGIYQFLRKRRTNFLACFLIATSFLVLYALMTGTSVSTVRAVGRLVVSMWGKVLGRSSDSLNSLGLVVVVLLFVNPFLLHSSGFLFSVGTVAGILIVGDVFEENEKKNRVYQALAGGIMPWLVTLPIVAYFYFEVPIYSFIVNMLVLPLVQYLFLFGLFGGIVGSVYLPIGRILLWPCQVILFFYEIVAKLSHKLPGATVITGRPQIWQILAYYVLLFAGVWYLKKRRVIQKTQKERKQKSTVEFLVRKGIFRGMLLAALLAIIFLPTAKQKAITALDVGQGDGIHIEAGQGRQIFVDGGSSSKSKLGNYILLPYLKYNGIRHIDYWVISHFDEDHISGCMEVLNSDYRVRYLILAKVWRDTENQSVLEMIELAEKHHTQILWVEAGDELQLAGGRLLFLYPSAAASKDVSNLAESENALSLSFLLEMDGMRGIFAGDATAETERAILEQYEDEIRNVDYYKANHHGSKYSNSSEWLAVIQPRYTVISCGKNNERTTKMIQA